MKNWLLPLLLAAFLGTCVRAQPINLNNNRVVAAGGVNLRSAPGLHGSILAKIPLDSLVEVLDSCDYGLDTVGSIPDFLEVYHPAADSFSRAPMHLSGAWVKATYHQDTGFLFNAYLFDYEPVNWLTEYAEITQPYVDAGLKGDYVFFRPGYELFAPINHHNDYYWHGIFGKEGHYRLERMSLEYVVSHHATHTFLNLVPGKTKDLVYIIGSKKRIPDHAFTGGGFEGGLEIHDDAGFDQKQLRQYSLSITQDTLVDYPSVKQLWLHRGKQQQSLSLPGLFGRPLPTAVGDVDGDGKSDVITYHDGETGHLILHLSREAGRGQLVHPVAEELLGDCC